MTGCSCPCTSCSNNHTPPPTDPSNDTRYIVRMSHSQNQADGETRKWFHLFHIKTKTKVQLNETMNENPEDMSRIHGKSHPPFPSILSWQAQCTLAQCAGHSCPSQTKIRWTWTHSVHSQEHTIAHLLYRNTNRKCWSSKQKPRRFLVQSTNSF